MDRGGVLSMIKRWMGLGRAREGPAWCLALGSDIGWEKGCMNRGTEG
jgi:hypothetical protein